MRELNLEAAIWNLFTSAEFFEAAARECVETTDWIGSIATSRGAANLGRINQIIGTLEKLGRDFHEGMELARIGDYESIWDTACSVPGKVRGLMEQQLHGWMSEAEYDELSSARISRLMTYAGQIESALNNAMTGADAFYDLDPEGSYRMNDDDGFPGDIIIEWYRSYVDVCKAPFFWNLPDPLPDYSVDIAIACKTGDIVPWTGVWYPSIGLERYSLTFAIQGTRMQPAYRVVKTTEELITDDYMFPPPETLAVETTWHPVKLATPRIGKAQIPKREPRP